MGINNQFYQMFKLFNKSKVSVSYKEINIQQECTPDEISTFNLHYKVSNFTRRKYVI